MKTQPSAESDSVPTPLEQAEAVERAVDGSLSAHQLALAERIARLRLSDQQKRYCERYIVHFDDLRAYQEAGYSVNNAHAGVSFDYVRNNPGIKAYIDILREEILRRVNVSVDELFRELKAIATANISDYLEWDRAGHVKYKASSELSREQMSAILEIKETRYSDHSTITYKLHPKLQALSDLLERVEEMEKRRKEAKGPEELRVNFNKVMAMLADPKARKAIETLSSHLFNIPMEMSEASKLQLDLYMASMNQGRGPTKQGGKIASTEDGGPEGSTGSLPAQINPDSGIIIDVEVCEEETERY